MQVSSTVDLESDLQEIQSMTKKKMKKKQSLITLNVSIIAIEFTLYIIVFNILFRWRVQGFDETKYLALMVFILIIFAILSLNRNLFRLTTPYSGVTELFQLIRVIFLTFMITVGILFLMKVSVDFSRAVLILFFNSMLIISFGIRLIKRIVLYLLAYKRVLTKNVIIVGAGKVGINIYHRFNSSKGLGYRVVGYLDDNKRGKSILGGLNDLEEVISRYEVDEVVITIPSEREFVNKALKNVNKYKVKVKIIPELYDLMTTKTGFEHINLFPLVEVVEHRITGWHAVAKRIMDIVLSTIGIVCLSPIFLIICIAVKVDSRGPAVFRQRRIGKGGAIFYIYKFRSMILNAEEKLEENEELFIKYLENNYKLEPDEDPRITRIGRWLRKTSIDELPQLINVLKGEMSLVGPRPVVEKELREYENDLHDFLSVKPGITGYWQVSGRSDIGYPERTNIELYYVYNQSLMLDIKILLKTVATVLKREGAY